MKRALSPAKDMVRVVATAFGAESGMIGAALLAADPAAAEWGERRPPAAPMSGGRLVVCPTPIGNLEDVTLRVLAALREADLVACEDTRRTRVLLERYGVQATLALLPRAQRARAHARARRPDASTARSSRWCRTRGCRWSATRATCWSRAASPRGSRSRCCPGPSRRDRRAGGERAARGALALRRLPAAQARAARRRCFARRRDVVAFESPRRVGARSAVLAELDPARPVAVCRELTKLHEEVVRGSGRRARGALRGRAAARRGRARHRRRAAAHGRRPGRDRRRPPPGRGRRPRPPGRLGRRRAHGRSRQRSVPSCDERRTRPQRLTPRGPPAPTGHSVAAMRPASSSPHRPRGRRPVAFLILALLLLLAGLARRCRRRRAGRRRSRARRRGSSTSGPTRSRAGSTAASTSPRGGPVRAACAGRVVFAGRVAGEGTVSVRCGRWRVSYAPLEPHRGARGRARSARAPGSAARRAGSTSASAARAGASATSTRSASSAPAAHRRPRRRAAQHCARRSPPARPPALHRRGPILRARLPPHRPHPPPALAPWPVWLGLALGLTGLVGAGRLRLPYRRQEGAACRASSTSSSSPTTPSSP